MIPSAVGTPDAKLIAPGRIEQPGTRGERAAGMGRPPETGTRIGQ
jgi:hypothetical protein